MAPIIGGSEKCPQCSKSVYFAEEVRALGKKYHKICLKCFECHKLLDSLNCNDHGSNIFCSTCYRKNFGVHSAVMSPTSPVGKPLGMSSAPPGSDCCHRCGKVVYMAERVAGGSKYFHKSCYRCNTCAVSLDSNKLAVHEDEIYCKVCYGKNFGPKGYGFAGGASGLSMDTGRADEVATSNVPLIAQAMAAPLSSNGTDVTNGGDGTDTRDRCSRCSKVVYFAEKVMGIGQAYHKSCFKCTNCDKKLDSTTLTEHAGCIYCKSCYGRNFGPKGYGFSSSMMSEPTSPLPSVTSPVDDEPTSDPTSDPTPDVEPTSDPTSDPTPEMADLTLEPSDELEDTTSDPAEENGVADF